MVMIILGVLCSGTPSALAGEPTALELAKDGNRYIGEQAHDKVVQIHSEKSIGGTVPSIWFVSYYDPTATFKEVEVKYGSGKMLEVKRPFRIGSPQPLDMSRVKIDSDKALEIALKEPLLEKLTIRATSLKLERGDVGFPIWKVRIWASKLRNPAEMADLGEVLLSADEGKIIKENLHINRVD